jgi:hypothetical protein
MGRISGASDLQPTFNAEFRGSIGATEHLGRVIPAVDEIVNHQSGALFSHRRQDRACHIHGPEQERLDLIPDLFGRELFEEAGEKIAGIVDEDVDPAEFLDGRATAASASCGCVTSSAVANKLACSPIAAETFAASRPVATTECPAARGNLGDVHAQSTTGARDEPDLLFRHGLFGHEIFLLRQHTPRGSGSCLHKEKGASLKEGNPRLNRERLPMSFAAACLQALLDDQLISDALHAIGGFGDAFGLRLVRLRRHVASQRDDVVLHIYVHAAAGEFAFAQQLGADLRVNPRVIQRIADGLG